MNKVTVFLLFLAYSIVGRIASQEQSMKGIVQIIYSKDTLGYGKYWIKSHKFLTNKRQFDFVKDVDDLVGELVLFCDSLTLKYSQNRNKIYDLEEYRSQNRDSTPFLHEGGEIYRNEAGDFVIAFSARVKGWKKVKGVCLNRFYNQYYTCPIAMDQLNYPVFIAGNFKKVRPLRKSEIRQFKLAKSGEIKFVVGHCD